MNQIQNATAVLLAALGIATITGARATVFEDVTSEVGLGGGDYKAAWGDYNNDGWVDLFSGGNIWRNDGGTFTLVEPLVLYGEGIWGDYDNDGFLDIFCYTHHLLIHNLGGVAFEDQSPLLPTLPMGGTRGAAWGDFDGDGYLDLYVGGYESDSYEPDALLLNDHGTSFRLAWVETGDIDPGRGVTAADFDEDQDLDVYVSNYRLEANWLWLNDGDGDFTNVAHEYGAAGDYDGWSYSYGHTIGSAWGDLDNDGHLDLFVGNFSHPDPWQDRSKFLRNQGPSGDWHFEDRTDGAGLPWQESYASPALGDCDNDGDLDLFLTTVYPGDQSVLMRNDGDWRFTLVNGQWIPAIVAVTYQAAWADYDNDGALDLLTGGRLFRNTLVSNHWLKVKLIGAGTVNRDAIGAQVRIELGSRTLLRQVESSTGESNGNDLTLHFGLGSDEGPVTLWVTWPDGSEDQMMTPVNRMIAIEKQDPAEAPRIPVTLLVPRLEPASPNPFRRQTALRFLLPHAARVSLSIHDTQGRRRRTLLSGLLEAGGHEVIWNGRDDGGSGLVPGVYFVRLDVPGGVVSAKLVLAR